MPSFNKINYYLAPISTFISQANHTFYGTDHKPDTAEFISNKCLGILRTPFGKNYIIHSHRGKFELVDSIDYKVRIVTGIVLIVLAPLTALAGIVGTTSLYFSKTHRREFKNLTLFLKNGDDRQRIRSLAGNDFIIDENYLSNPQETSHTSHSPNLTPFIKVQEPHHNRDDDYDLITPIDQEQYQKSVEQEIEALKGMRKLAYEAFSTGDHPWREKKFEYIMEGIQKGFLEEYAQQQKLPDQDAKSVHNNITTTFNKLPDSPLKTATLNAVTTLIYPDPNLSTQEQRNALINALTAARESSSYTNNTTANPCPPILQAIGNALMAQVHLHTFSEKLVFQFIEQKGCKSREVSQKNLIKRLKSDFFFIDNAAPHLRRARAGVTLAKMAGHFNVMFAPLHDSNFSSILYTENFGKASKEISCLRFGTPTEEWLSHNYAWITKRTEIITEMRLFLDYYKNNNKKHVYFNHQNPFNKGALHGDETDRCRAIQSLENDYPDNFFMINLPFDGKFFKQSGCYADLNNIDTFKATFAGLLISGKNGYHRPSDTTLTRLGISNLSKAINEILDNVQNDFFNEMTDLTSEQRVSFQLLAYARLEEWWMQQLDADSYNSSCKDCIDRGGVMNALRYYLYLLETGQENNPDKLNTFRVILHSPALMVKEQAVLKHRREHLIDVLKHLKTLPTTSFEGLRKKYSCKNHDVHIHLHDKQSIDNKPQPSTQMSPSGNLSDGFVMV